MSDLSNVCTLCNSPINAQFSVGPRTTQTISSDVIVTDACFVADEIIFTGKGKLIFTPNIERHALAVICRKLTVKGGNSPGVLDPCNPADPGTRYTNTNVITWQSRLKSANKGSAMPQAAIGGSPGATGANGNPGNPGDSGASPGGGRVTATLTILALEVDVQFGGNLVIDFAGQDGGDGGPGQMGGNGAKGATGANGKDASWPSSGCDTPNGNGGDGGDGGQGGIGGAGGNGGGGGQIIVITTSDNLSGPFSNPNQVTFVTQSLGGKGGNGGIGGNGGDGGNPGLLPLDCGGAVKGGSGTSFLGVSAGPGGGGAPGKSFSPHLEIVDTSGSCSSILPRDLVLPSTLPLQTFIRCFSGSANGDISITGQYLDQIASVSCSLAGVTATIKNSSTDTELDLSISIAANSATGPGDLIFNYSFPPGKTQTLSGAIVVELCQITSISPNTGAQGATLNPVTVTGTGFNPSGAVHNVNISGLGVNVYNVAVVDDQHLTCEIVIDSTAGKNARDVTVQAGQALSACSFTLPNAFTVT